MAQTNATSPQCSRDKLPLKRVEPLNGVFNGSLKWRFTDNFQTGLGNIWRCEQPVAKPFVPAKTYEISPLSMRLRVRTVTESVAASNRALFTSCPSKKTAALSSRRAGSAPVEGRQAKAACER